MIMKWNLLVNLFYSVVFFAAIASKYEVTATMEASVNVMALLENERLLIQYFTAYTKKMEEHVKEMRKYVDSLELIYNSKTTDYNEYLSHPVNHYLLMRRLTLDVEDISSKMKTPEEYLKLIDMMRSFSRLPKDGSFEQAVEGFIRLQTAYGLESTALSRGNLRSKIFSSIPEGASEPLSGADCYHLAKMYLKNENEEKQLEWFELGNALDQEEQFFEELAIEKTDENYDDDDTSKNEPFLLTENMDFTDQSTLDIYYRLCRGEKIRPLSWEKDLRCGYFAGHNAYYFIQPVKMEILSDDPFIAQFYDIINDNEINSLKELGTKKLTQALGVDVNGSIFLTPARISFNSWINSNANEVTQRLSKKLDMLIGLKSNEDKGCGEEFQLNNYGTGGLYVPHYDYFFPGQEKAHQCEENGNRIATFMYYASDVPSGGATVFPYAGATAWPKKGSAVFWWNLKPNGEVDDMTFHGGCPVLYGSKWVVNRWIRSHCQMSVRKCDLNPNSYYLDV